MPFIHIKPAGSDRDYYLRTDAIDAVYQSLDYPYAKSIIAMNSGKAYEVKERPQSIVKQIDEAAKCEKGKVNEL